ncbi:hypothetical protein PODOV084v1_p0035 [Vibrio phage 340E47.2]|nr:hypothetical protein PODOV084v1_p0035 [Vibrio phage 340E47.2]QZI91940.1 hypothetical protein PODOV077v1_p0029 [Vibrio phage 5P1a]
MTLARSKKLQASARGQDCALRLIGTCNGNPETVVLCHIGKVRGMACKAGDNMAIFACSACHDAIDGRAKYDKELNPNLAEDFLRALEETQQIHIDNELMVIK